MVISVKEKEPVDDTVDGLRRRFIYRTRKGIGGPCGDTYGNMRRDPVVVEGISAGELTVDGHTEPICSLLSQPAAGPATYPRWLASRCPAMKAKYSPGHRALGRIGQRKAKWAKPELLG
jgi:hypothetical protein